MADKNKGNSFIDKGTAFFLLLATAIIPLIVRIRRVPVGQYEYGIIRASSVINDMFSYNKAVALCVLALVILAYLALGIVLEEKRVKLKLKSVPSYLMYGYIGLCLISSIFSNYKGIAFWGISERYEGFFVLLSYGVLFITAMSFTVSEKAIKYMLGIFSLSVLFIGAIGTLQTLGFDIFATTVGSKLVLGQYYAGENLSLKFESAYGTLYNPNCLGMYSGMMASFMLMPAVLLPVKNKFKYMFALLFVLAVVCMLGSDSVGGLLGFSCACVFSAFVGAVCFFKKRLYKNGKYLAVTVTLVIAVIAVPMVLVSSNAKIIQKFNIITDTLSGKTEFVNTGFYEDFVFNGDTATIVTKAGNINITATDGDPVVEQNGTVREVQATAKMEGETKGHVNSYLIDGLDKGEMQVYNDKLVFLGYDADGNKTNFIMRKTDNGIIPLDKFGADIDINNPVPSVGFKGIESLGSGRGYIWSRSIPLLKDNIIIGKGPDSFALEFPQEDIVAKLNYLGNPYIIVDKPHSLYLQSAINTGVLSTLLIIVLALLCIIQTVYRLIVRNDSTIINAARLACMSGIIAYMVAGATTDSVVSVAPVFWIMLGTAYGINCVKSAEGENGKA